jgi:hypothetical protein
MESKEIINEHIQHLLKEDNIYTQRITNIFNVEITDENINDLETLINLLEIHEEALKQTRRILQLKLQYYMMNYMESLAHSKCE